jgi:micrococcal nuclease
VRFAAFAIVFLAAYGTTLADGRHYEITGKVVMVEDGDTLTVLDEDKRQYKIWLAGIDAPDKGQPFATKARENLAGKVFGRTVRVEGTLDYYWSRRLVGRVYLGDRLINAEMVCDGYAWRYVPYDARGEFTAAETEARKHRRGLWAEKSPMPPWEWRKVMAAYAD